ncbi:LuxR C-terminal-related transcriptional regulator [Streptomyces sp. NPDC006527]|uniref:LuxR C-terminal-related transcriptional regulator n=1 Tax=Streptomyces sp. NPDC006527 TaxID=3364749 RepID=UPI003681BA4E
MVVTKRRAHLDAAREAGIARISPHLALLVEGSAALCVPEAQADARYDAVLSMDAAELYPFEQARLLLAYGQQLRRARRREEAVARLQMAWETFEWLGAQRWAFTAAAELRAAGHAVQRAGAGDLTGQELLIAQLAAQGLTNKQIGAQLNLSPRTISTHLYSAFPKLGVTSPAALRDALGTAGGDGGAPG